MRLILCSLLTMLLVGCNNVKPVAPAASKDRPTGTQARRVAHDRMVMNEFAAYKAEFTNFPPDVSTNDRSTVYHFVDGTLTLWWTPDKYNRFATLENVQFIDRR